MEIKLMNSYLILSVSLILVSLLLHIRLRLKWINTKILLLVFLILFVMMIIFNSYLTGLPIVMYNSNSILNIRVGSIPIEDFGYLISAVILIPALYEKFNSEK